MSGLDDAVARFDRLLAAMPIVAILRGLRTDEAVAVVQALFDAGIRVAEVPLNSPDPFATIALLVKRFGDRMMIGAGTVTNPAEVHRLAECAATWCVSPSTNPVVIEEALRLGLVPLPGCATATEAFAALGAGARHLKFFPAGGHVGDIAALRSVLPRDVALFAVGGVGLQAVPELRRAGVAAFGIGSDIYKPGYSPDDVSTRARAFVRAMTEPAPARLLCNPAAVIGESPVLRTDGAIVWTDPVERLLLEFRDGDLREHPVERSIWSLASLPDGRLAGTCDTGFCIVGEDGAIAAGPVASVEPGCRFNDMAVDAFGGLWAGVMHKGLLATRGEVFHAGKAGVAPRCVARGLGVPNGMAFSDDGTSLFVIDTLARTLLAFPADPSAGTLGEPVVVSDFLDLPGKPDGMVLGPDGTFLVAMWGGGCVVQLSAQGAVMRTLPVPCPHVSSVLLDGDRLIATTSRMRLTSAQLANYANAGGLFAVEL